MTTDTSIKLVEDFFKYSGSTSISMYTIINSDFKRTNSDFGSIIVELEFEREMLNIILSTILPSALIVIVS